MAEKGKCIVIEGIDGSGKSTQARALYQQFSSQGIDAVLTCEPSSGPVGKLIRQVLSGRQALDQRAIANLFAADRTDHLMNQKNGIRHMVDQGKTVVCDRYYFSSYAYHSQYMDMDWVFSINECNAQILRPDLTIFIDVPPGICVERIRSSRQSFDIYEDIDMLSQVRRHYFTAFQRCASTETIIIIDGDQPSELVARNIWNATVKAFQNNPEVR